MSSVCVYGRYQNQISNSIPVYVLHIYCLFVDMWQQFCWPSGSHFNSFLPPSYLSGWYHPVGRTWKPHSIHQNHRFISFPVNVLHISFSIVVILFVQWPPYCFSACIWCIKKMLCTTFNTVVDESALILLKVMWIICLTLDKWRQSLILPTLQCLMYFLVTFVFGHTCQPYRRHIYHESTSIL